MSAIWGSINYSGALSTQSNEIMRKPYDTKCKIDQIRAISNHSLLFGCGIQYITKEAQGEILPICDEANHLYFTADCLLDNRNELIQKLGIFDSTTPDGTLMYHAYLKWGIDCVKHFRGIFSLAAYQTDTQTLFLAVDQTASRCLYYYKTKSNITFSTLLAPILALHENIPFNSLFLKDYLIAPGMLPNITSKDTPHENVFKLDPGTYLVITKDNITEYHYWTPAIKEFDIHCKSEKEYGNYFRTLYASCVQDALRTDGNHGITLSSGLDSSTVGAIAADFLKQSEKELFTYTYIPVENVSHTNNRSSVINEQEDVLRIVAMYPNMKPKFLTNEGKNCFEEIPKILNTLEFPYKSLPNSPSLYEIYGQASTDGCKVVLSGQVGNSTVSYGYIDNILYDLFLNKKYLTFVKYLNHYSKTVKESRKKALADCWNYFNDAKKAYESEQQIEYTPDNPFLDNTILKDYPLEQRFKEGQVHLLGHFPAPRQFYQNYSYSSSALTYLGEIETKMGLTHGIILRDPTRDMRMISFCYHLPYHMFAYKGIPRWLIRGNLRDKLPSSIIDNWMRQGIQNSDWYYRINRDWNQLLPKIKNTLDQPQISKYICNSEVSKFYEMNQEKLPSKSVDTTRHLIYLCIFSQFLSLQKQE